MESKTIAKSIHRDSKDKEKKSASVSSSKHKEKDEKEKSKEKKSSKHSDASRNLGKNDRKSPSPTPFKRRQRSSSGTDDEENVKKSKGSRNDEGSTGDSGGAGDISLSIEETNKLRIKLGLKPLNVEESNKKSGVDPSKPNTYIDKETYEEFEHKPAHNIAEIREQKEFRQKLEEQREKRRLLERLEQLKKKEREEGEADEEDESAEEWLRKIKEKEEAKRKAAMLEEMDKQFEETSEILEKSTKRANKTPAYGGSDLKGFKVEHDISIFKEGQEVILTLKDRAIVRGSGENVELDDDEDALVNVNIIDSERAAKNVELRKKKPGYNPYDDFDEEGNFKVKGILDKYDEELTGEQKKSFKLGKGGTYDLSDENFIAKLNEEHKSRAIKLDASDFKLTNDYYTAEEMEKFKKPKKVRKVLRKSRAVKADDLLPLEPIKSTERESTTTATQSTNSSQPVRTSGKVSLKEIDFGIDEAEKSNEEENDVKMEPRNDSTEENDDDDDDFIDTEKLDKQDEQELRRILEEENEELHNILNKTRKRVIQPLTFEIKAEEPELSENGVDFDRLEKTRDDEMVLDTISEFCRNIKSEPHVGNSRFEEEDHNSDIAASMRKKNEMEIDDDEIDQDDQSKIENGGEKMSDEESLDKKDQDQSEDEANILDAEPIINRGCMSAILLARNKGYLNDNNAPQTSRGSVTTTAKASSIRAANYTVEERSYYDIDDKYNRNRGADRYSSGPLVDFDEKKGYKPDVKLDYFDEKGRAMNEKEAFRYLSHRFHGKGSGKIKTEKRLKKQMEAESMNKMSSVDTPLNTVALMQDKQKKLQQPFIVLSARKKDHPEHIGK